MSLYNLPKHDFSQAKNKILKVAKNRVFLGLASLAAAVIVFVFLGGSVVLNLSSQTMQFAKYFNIPEIISPELKFLGAREQNQVEPYSSNISYEQAIINTVKIASPSVVSIVISKNLPVYEQQYVNPFSDLGPGFEIEIPQYVQNGTQLQEIGAGSGLIVSSGGLVLTNKHVVSDSTAEYTVFTNDGNEYKAKVVALDPLQDLALVKIEPSGTTFKAATLGDSSSIQIGQTVVAIGNALGEFTNTVSVGVVSGLQRTVSASDQSGSFSETLQGIIQTDAAINEGNSGGPLLNLKGEVIGINTAVAQGAQNIGFAIPINLAKRDITQVEQTNKIIYPFLGVRYVLVDKQIQKEYNVSVNYGALVLKGLRGEPAVTEGSAAQNAGIQSGDIILEVDGIKISSDNPLSNVILEHSPGDQITIKILRDSTEMILTATLGQASS